ncbi:MAG: PTS sugar transporter subunit IIC [Clostridiales bacterium]|nr:PTS sugar transporter subunit IIC [Clostridiales bacterium]
MEKEKQKKNRQTEHLSSMIRSILKRYFVDAVSAMALGLFASLIIGLILSQFSKIPYLEFLSSYADMASNGSVVGAAIGAAIAWGLKSKPLVIFSCVVVGAFGYGAGGPVGAYAATVVGAELARLVAGRTKVDIVLTPLATILPGCVVGQLVGPPVQWFMSMLGGLINTATNYSPFLMGLVISVVVGMALTAPISSAALCIMLDLNGLAGGAATVGCCAQMIGFAVTSFRDNRWGGLVAQGLGTSMLQVGNIVRRPQIWIAPTLSSAILGPLATCVFKMQNTATGAGMGTSGLVGQFGTFAAMSGTTPVWWLMIEIFLLHFLFPAILALGIDWMLRKIGWVRPGDMKLYQAE